MKKLEELNFRNKRIIIFDLDGTLIDSIGIWNRTDQKLIQDYSGITVDLNVIQVDRDNFINNNSSSDIYVAYSQYLIDKYKLTITSAEKLNELRAKVANEVLKKEIGFKPGVVSLILKLKELHFKLALATITTESQLDIYCHENEKMLSELNIKETFDFITTKESVDNKKPAPDVYLKIMEYFKVKPEQCLVFEDSLTGVLAANQAGIEVVNVYDKHSDVDRDRINGITDYFISGYNEFISMLICQLGYSVRSIRISDDRELRYIISNDSIPTAYTIQEYFTQNGRLICGYELSQWDDYEFSARQNNDDGAITISFEFNTNHPLYFPLFHLLDYDDELVIDDDKTKGVNVCYMKIYKKDDIIFVDFIDNSVDKIYKADRFRVFVKNTIHDGRSKIDQNYLDTKKRLAIFFEEVHNALNCESYQITIEEYMLSMNCDLGEMKRVFKRN